MAASIRIAEFQSCKLGRRRAKKQSAINIIHPYSAAPAEVPAAAGTSFLSGSMPHAIAHHGAVLVHAVLHEMIERIDVRRRNVRIGGQIAERIEVA